MNMSSAQVPDRRSWAILILLSIVWGCSFILIKKSLIAFTPIQVACLRISISSLAFVPFVWYYRNQIQWTKWPKFLAVGLAGSGIPAFLFSFAQTEISSSVAGLLNSLTPIWALLIGIFVFRLKFNPHKLVGVIIGFMGAASLLLLGSHSTLGGNPVFGLLIVIATICYGTSVNLIQAFFNEDNPVIVASFSFVLMLIPSLLVLWMTGFSETMVTHDQAYYSLGAVSILAVVGTMMANTLFYDLVQKTSAVFGSTVTYLMPIIAVFWGLADGEPITWLHGFGMLLILTGVYITKK